MFIVRVTALALFALTAGATASPQAAPLAPYDKVVLPPDATPTHYALEITPDAPHLAFEGKVAIDVAVKKPTTRLSLNTADLAFKSVTLDGAAPKATDFNKDQETATFTFAAPLSVGSHKLAISYTGKIYEQASGLFALDYPTKKGKARALFTQFENSDARRFLPSWDEPGVKATFQLTAIVPKDEMPVSNMPIASTKALAGGLKQVAFANSPKMSSYLLFFALGDFERVHKTIAGVDVGVIVRRGETAKAAFALEAQEKLLPYYNDYFGVKYPLPKLDMLAAPGSSQFFSAMENWGAIMYFEDILLVDPKTATPTDKQEIFSVVAHETAHQWFGDLVTMHWWDDLWLNEGFASWMQEKAADKIHPEWKPWLLVVGTLQGAMGLDSREGTHPIITQIHDVLEASNAFDDITYNKGEAVIRMIEAYVGEKAFRDGVRAYMKAHAYGNTVTDDLWRELDKTSATPVTPIAHDFTLQAGVPLVSAKLTSAGVELKQERFGVDDFSKKAQLIWRVPVVVRSAGAPTVRAMVDSAKPHAVAIAAKADQPIIVNAGQTGYFRTRYDDALFARVVKGFGSLKPEDQLGLLSDTYYLGAAGYAPMAQIMDLLSKVPANADPVVVSSQIGRLSSLDGLFGDTPDRVTYRTYVRSVLAPLKAKLGWDAKKGESANLASLRGQVLGVLGQADDPDILAEARKRFDAFLVKPSSLDPVNREVVLRLVAYNADAATWEKIHELGKKTESVPEKLEYYGLLGRARDPKLVKQAIDMSLSGELPPTLAPVLFRGATNSQPEMALDFVIQHWSDLANTLEPTVRYGLVPRLAGASSDPATIAKLTAWADANMPAGGRGEVVKATSAIRYSAQLRTQRAPEIAKWLSDHR